MNTQMALAHPGAISSDHSTKSRPIPRWSWLTAERPVTQHRGPRCRARHAANRAGVAEAIAWAANDTPRREVNT